jgi:hypothetical protein
MVDDTPIESLNFFVERAQVLRRLPGAGLPGDDLRSVDPTTRLVMKFEALTKLIEEERRSTFGCGVLNKNGKVTVSDPDKLAVILAELEEHEASLVKVAAAIRALDEMGAKYMYKLEGHAGAMLDTVPQAKRVLDSKIDVARRQNFKLEIQDILKLPEIVEAQKIFDETKTDHERNSKKVHEEIAAARAILSEAGI